MAARVAVCRGADGGRAGVEVQGGPAVSGPGCMKSPGRVCLHHISVQFKTYGRF